MGEVHNKGIIIKQGDDDNLNIGLMGFEFSSANKGCEALSYSFINFLSEYFKDEPLTIYVWDTKLGEIPSNYPNIHFFYVTPSIKDLKFKWIKTVMHCDYIFDITMGDSFSDIYSLNYCLGLLKVKRRVELLNKHYILMPQTYGPFNNDKVRKKSIRIIQKASRVISRDKSSIEYLNSIGVNRRIEERIDLAFLLPYDRTKYIFENQHKKLGINVSGLLWRGGFKKNNQFDLTLDYQKYIRAIIEYYSSNNEWEIHLIPHVIDLKENAYDDDCYVIKQLHNEFPSTIIAPEFDNPIDAKSYIANMDCFIGSRMHSTIAAISSGVPVIPVSYSRKFEGLFDTLDYKFLIHGNKYDTNTSIDTTIQFVNNFPELSLCVKSSKKTIDSKIQALKIELTNIISEHK